MPRTGRRTRSRRGPGRILAWIFAACAGAWATLACSGSGHGSADSGSLDAADSGVGEATARDGARGDGDGVDGGTPEPLPTLVALAVSSSDPSDAAPAIQLAPAFASGVHDYYVRCAAGTNRLDVSMTASSGSDSRLVSPTQSARRTKQTLHVAVTDGDAIVAEAVNESGRVEYWVRCLPGDFPRFAWVEHPDAGKPPAGYYLVGTQLALSTPPYAIVLTDHGAPIWYLRGPAGNGYYDVDHLSDAGLSFKPFPAKTPFEVHVLTPPGSTTFVAPSGLTDDEHDLQRLPNGHYLVLTDPLAHGVDLTGLTAELPDGGSEALGPDASIQNCTMREIDESGNEYWKWSATDHLDPVLDSKFPPEVLSPGVYNVFHFNSIDVDPANGNILVSARNLDSVFYVDKKSTKILWKMGGSAFTKDGAVYVPVADPFYRQHDARLVPGWEPACQGGTGQVSVFDDETARPGPARGVVYDVRVGLPDGGTACDGGAPDASAGPGAAVAWEYDGPSASGAMGSFRLYPDGSRLVGWGQGPFQVVFTAVDDAKRDLVDFTFTDGNRSYRAIKIPLGAFTEDTLRHATAQP